MTIKKKKSLLPSVLKSLKFNKEKRSIYEKGKGKHNNGQGKKRSNISGLLD